MQKLLPRQHLPRVRFEVPQDMCRSGAATASEASYSWGVDNRVSDVCTLNIIMHTCVSKPSDLRLSMDSHVRKEVSSFGYLQGAMTVSYLTYVKVAKTDFTISCLSWPGTGTVRYDDHFNRKAKASQSPARVLLLRCSDESLLLPN